MKRMEIKDYIRIISMVKEVPEALILDSTRVDKVVNCRRLICLVCADVGYTVKELARELKRDRTTIDHLLEIGRFRVKQYPSYRQEYETIKRRLA
jgi:hypothetical protein